jgi:hypothetical protein
MEQHLCVFVMINLFKQPTKYLEHRLDNHDDVQRTERMKVLKTVAI